MTAPSPITECVGRASTHAGSDSCLQWLPGCLEVATRTPPPCDQQHLKSIDSDHGGGAYTLGCTLQITRQLCRGRWWDWHSCTHSLSVFSKSMGLSSAATGAECSMSFALHAWSSTILAIEMLLLHMRRNALTTFTFPYSTLPLHQLFNAKIATIT